METSITTIITYEMSHISYLYFHKSLFNSGWPRMTEVEGWGICHQALFVSSPGWGKSQVNGGNRVELRERPDGFTLKFTAWPWRHLNEELYFSLSFCLVLKKTFFILKLKRESENETREHREFVYFLSNLS